MREYATAAAILALSVACRTSVGTPPKYLVSGAGQHLAFGTGPAVVSFGIKASSGPSGESPAGEMAFNTEGERVFRAEVTCLIVAGNTAIATGKLTAPESAAGGIVVGHFVSNGQAA